MALVTSMALGSALSGIQQISGGPKKERKTMFGKFLQKVTTGSNYSGSGSGPAPAVQNRPLASGTINFGGEQRNRNLLNIAGMAVIALLGYQFFGRGKKRRRR